MHETGGLSWSWPCRNCGCTCVIFQDDFQRADSTDLGVDWDEVAGGWAIASGQAQTADASARLQVAKDLQHGFDPTGDPWGAQTFAVRSNAVTITIESAGGQGRLYAQRNSTIGEEVYAEWEVTATAGKLSIWVDLGSGAGLRHGPFVFPGRGAGVATRLRLCNRLTEADDPFEIDELARVHVLDPATGDLLFRTASVKVEAAGTGDLLGQEHGVATGAVPSGVVKFDDYVVEQLKDQRDKCPECAAACPCDALCLRLPLICYCYSSPATGGCAEDVVLERWPLVIQSNQIFPGGGPAWSGPSGIDPCFDQKRVICQWTLGFQPAGGFEYWAYLHQDADDHWYLSAAISQLAHSGSGADDERWWRADLGTDPPLDHCQTWKGLPLFRHAACDVDAALGDADPIENCIDMSVPLTASGGEACYYYDYYGSGHCCGGETLAQFLYATVFKNGGDHYGTQPLDKVFQTADSYRYENGLVDPGIDHVLVCGNQVAQYTFKDQDTGNYHTVTMTVTSCDPYLASGTLTEGGNTYDVEIRE